MQCTDVLLSELDGRFYTGWSSDLLARIHEHNAGAVRSTAYRRPLRLIYYEACLDPDDARRRERFLKTGKGKRYLNKLLEASLGELRGDTLERY